MAEKTKEKLIVRLMYAPEYMGEIIGFKRPSTRFNLKLSNRVIKKVFKWCVKNKCQFQYNIRDKNIMNRENYYIEVYVNESQKVVYGLAFYGYKHIDFKYEFRFDIIKKGNR